MMLLAHPNIKISAIPPYLAFYVSMVNVTLEDLGNHTESINLSYNFIQLIDYFEVKLIFKSENFFGELCQGYNR